RKLVLLSIVVVPDASSGRFWTAQVAPVVSARLMITPPCSTPAAVHRSGRHSTRARPSSGRLAMTSTPSGPANGTVCRRSCVWRSSTVVITPPSSGIKSAQGARTPAVACRGVTSPVETCDECGFDADPGTDLGDAPFPPSSPSRGPLTSTPPWRVSRPRPTGSAAPSPTHLRRRSERELLRRLLGERVVLAERIGVLQRRRDQAVVGVPLTKFLAVSGGVCPGLFERRPELDFELV